MMRCGPPPPPLELVLIVSTFSPHDMDENSYRDYDYGHKNRTEFGNYLTVENFFTGGLIQDFR